MAKSDDPLFNIHFVRAVESRPCIWNNTLVEYSRRNIVEQAWEEIAEESNDSVLSCRDRWRNLRGAFLRSLKNPPHGSRTKKKYYLDEYLQFLRPFAKPKSTVKGNSESLAETNENYNDIKTESEEEYTEYQEFNLESHNGPENYDIAQSTSSRDATDESVILSNNSCSDKKRKFYQDLAVSQQSDDRDFVEWLKRKKGHSGIHEDPNMSFLHSLLPDMMKMTDKQNRRFRQKVIGLMDDILEDGDISQQQQ